MSSGFTRKLLSLIFVLAGVVAAQTTPPRKDIPAIAKAANGAIITIITAANDKPIAQGTGFVVSPDGVIVTNYHVIKEGNVAVIKFPDGSVLPVDGVLAADKVRDLAVIKIHGKTFRTLALGNSDHIQVGEEVVAIGNPLSLESTVSNGIVSGVRTSKEQGGKFLQTTAPISPGSSGGPLFNMFGEVVGINTLYLEGGENLNFAIPVNDAKSLLSIQSTKLQNLPNEAEPPKESPKVPPDAPSLLDLKITCNKLAEHSYDKHTLVYRHATDVSYTSSWNSHLDTKTSICFVIVTEIMKGKVISGNDPPYILTTFSITIYDALEDAVCAEVVQNWSNDGFADQEELLSVGFVHKLDGDFSKSILIRLEDKEKGLTWFRIAVLKTFGIRL